MNQVSEIIVYWTPQTSGRVISIQIQSRIVGTEQWTEQAAAFDPAAGEFRFQSNAPATDVEVRTRYRMMDGVFGPWDTDHIVTQPAVVQYGEVEGTPNKLADVNPAEGGKLDGIQPGADVTKDNTSRDTAAVGGVPAATVIIRVTDVEKAAKDAMDRANTVATTAGETTAKAVTDLTNKINSDVSGAKTEAANALATNIGEVKQSIRDLQAGSGVDETARASIRDNDVVYKAADKALADRQTNFETAIGDANSRINTVDTALTTKDAAINKRVDDSITEFRGLNGTTNTRITEEISSISSSTGGFVQRAAALEAAVSNISTSIVRNDNFNYWPDGQPHPAHWIPWSTGGNYRTNRLAPGRGGGQYCVQTLNDIAEVDSGFYQQVYRAGVGKWVIDVTVNGDSSGLRGAGVTLNGIWNLDFTSEPDINGYAGDSTGGEVRTWSKMIDLDARVDLINVHGMVGWSGFGRGMAAKYMVWHKLSLRPATDGEIKAGKADAALNNPGGLVAKVNSHESAIVNLPANYASAGRANTLEAQMSRAVPSALNSYIDGVNGRIDSVNSTTVTNLNSRIEERAQAWASQEAGAVATRANTIEAQMRREIASPINSYVDAVNGRIDSVNSTTVTNVNARIEDRASAWARQEAGAVASTVSTLRTEYNQSKGEISSISSVASDAYGRTRAFLQQTAIANGNRAQISLFADSNGGAGVDIIGDVAFRGSLNVGPDSGGNRVKITNSGMSVFDANGTMRVRLGLW